MGVPVTGPAQKRPLALRQPEHHHGPGACTPTGPRPPRHSFVGHTGPHESARLARLPNKEKQMISGQRGRAGTEQNAGPRGRRLGWQGLGRRRRCGLRPQAPAGFTQATSLHGSSDRLCNMYRPQIEARGSGRPWFCQYLFFPVITRLPTAPCLRPPCCHRAAPSAGPHCHGVQAAASTAVQGAKLVGDPGV